MARPLLFLREKIAASEDLKDNPPAELVDFVSLNLNLTDESPYPPDEYEFHVLTLDDESGELELETDMVFA